MSMTSLLPRHAPLSLAQSPSVSLPSSRAAGAGLTAVALLLVAALAALAASPLSYSALSSSSTADVGTLRHTTHLAAGERVEPRDYRRHLTFAYTRTKTWDGEKSSGELVTTKGLKGFVTSVTINFPGERAETEADAGAGAEEDIAAVDDDVGLVTDDEVGSVTDDVVGPVTADEENLLDDETSGVSGTDRPGAGEATAVSNVLD